MSDWRNDTKQERQDRVEDDWLYTVKGFAKGGYDARRLAEITRLFAPCYSLKADLDVLYENISLVLLSWQKEKQP